MNYIDTKNNVLNELNAILSSVKPEEIEKFTDLILSADEIVLFGAGRMGLSLKAFAMRLNHIGIKAYYFTDNYIPPMTENSVFLVASGSGMTTSVVNYLKLAYSKAKVKIAAIVGNEFSSIAKMSNAAIIFKPCNGGLNSEDSDKKIDSIQIMSTLNEQFIYILCDILALNILDKKGINKLDTKKNHFNIE